MNDLILILGTEKDFFERGQKLARNIDIGNTLETKHILSFEDIEDLKSKEQELLAKKGQEDASEFREQTEAN